MKTCIKITFLIILLSTQSCTSPGRKTNENKAALESSSPEAITHVPSKTPGTHSITKPLNKADLAKLKQEQTDDSKQIKTKNKHKLPNGLYAEFNTSKGTIIAKLFYNKVPLTVANFVGLAEGTKYSKRLGLPFYNNSIFYHVARNFTVRAGCPKGNGTSGPGYRFPDEFHPSLKHDKAGILSMANIGPDTNGSQFFFTLKSTPWLDGRNAIFGEVIKGLDVLRKIHKGDKINKVTILRVGDKVKNYHASQELFNKLLQQKLTKEGKILKTGPKNPRTIFQKW